MGGTYSVETKYPPSGPYWSTVEWPDSKPKQKESKASDHPLTKWAFSTFAISIGFFVPRTVGCNYNLGQCESHRESHRESESESGAKVKRPFHSLPKDQTKSMFRIDSHPQRRTCLNHICTPSKSTSSAPKRCRNCLVPLPELGLC